MHKIARVTHPSARSDRRDLRIDLARGLCLWLIVVWHTPENLLRPLTLHGFAVCDQADAFVFLCGVSAALAYGRKLDRAGWWEAAGAVLGRVRTIYLAHLGLVATLAALVTASRAAGLAGIEHFFWLDGQAFDAAALLRLAALVNQPGLLAILPLYIVLLLWFAVIMPLIRHPLPLLGLSAGLWIAVHLWPGSIRIGATFNAVAWQLTFTLGVLASRYPDALRGRWCRVLDLAALGVLATGAWAIWTLPHTWEAYDQLSLPLRVLVRGRSKGDLDLGRVLSVLALAWLLVRLVPRDARWLRARWAAVLVGLGQRSLPVFAAGIVVTGLSRWVLTAAHQGLAAEVAVNAAGLACLWTAGHLARLGLGGIWAALLRRPPGAVGGADAGAAASAT